MYHNDSSGKSPLQITVDFSKTSLVENILFIRIIRVRNTGTNSGDSQRIDAMHTTYSELRSGGIVAMKALLNSSTCVLHMIHHHQKIHTKISYILKDQNFSR